jgi:hypothetical protein
VLVSVGVVVHGQRKLFQVVLALRPVPGEQRRIDLFVAGAGITRVSRFTQTRRRR